MDDLAAEEEGPGAADGVIAELAGVVADADGPDASEVEPAEGLAAEVVAFVDGDIVFTLGDIACRDFGREDGRAAEEVFEDGDEELVLGVELGEVEVAAEEADLFDTDCCARTSAWSEGVVEGVAGECEPDAGDQRAIAQALVRQLGMERLDGHLCAEDDGLSSIQVMPAGTRHEGYIPYSDRPISWHTDGYYNSPDRQIHSMLLHCAQDALEGGENCILDHEIVYIQLRDENPDYIRALMRPDAMRIPANVENGVEIRPAVDGPVFSVSADGALHMRYTARTRSIEWHPDPVVQAAAERLRSLLSDDNPYVLRLRLRPGQGILSNNVLHNRTRFTDSEDGSRKRLVYRARCHDRIDNISSHRACLG